MKLGLTVLVIVSMLSGPAIGQYEQEENTLLVFFDEEGVVNCRSLGFTGAPILVTAHLLLVNPTAESVHSWEARVTSDIACLDTGAWVLNGGTNASAHPDFVVDMGSTPHLVEPCSPVLLASREMLYFMVTGEFASFQVSEVEGSTTYGGHPGFTNESGERFPLEEWNTDYPQSFVNVDCCHYDPACTGTFWRAPMIQELHDYDESGAVGWCDQSAVVRLSGDVITEQGLFDATTIYIDHEGHGIRVQLRNVYEQTIGGHILLTGVPRVLEGEVVITGAYRSRYDDSLPASFTPIDVRLDDLESGYEHVARFIRLYGDVVYTDASGLVLTDAGAELRVAVPASLGVDPTAYSPGQTLTVTGIFSIMGGRHLIVRDAAEIVEGNVASESRKWGGVKALFR